MQKADDNSVVSTNPTNKGRGQSNDKQFYTGHEAGRFGKRKPDNKE